MPRFESAAARPKKEDPREKPKPVVEELSSEMLEEEPEVEDVSREAVLEEDVEEVSGEHLIEMPEHLQEADVIEAFEVGGFKGLEVTGTLEKKSERKGKEKERNQDNVLADPETGLVGVMDGLGGEGQGDKASKAAEQAIIAGYKQSSKDVAKMSGAEVQQRLVEQQLTKLGNPGKRKEVTQMVEGMLSLDPKLGKKALSLIEGIRSANRSVTETGGKTTACIGFVHGTPDGKKYAVVANVGDSVGFKRRNNGEMVPLTQEDSLLNAMQNSGTLSPELMAKMKADPDKKMPIPLTLDLVRAAGGGEKEFRQFQANGVKEMPMSYKKLKVSMVGALGSEMFEPSLVIRELKPGEELILMTDIADNFENAQTNEMDNEKIAKAYQGKTQTERLDNLRKQAKDGPKDDDAALMSIKVKE